MKQHIAQPELEQAIPGKTMEYLWDLAENMEDDRQTFELSLANLSGHEVQEIVHRSGSRHSEIIHKVAGLQPVNCNILVDKDEQSCKMKILA
ncbi:MAG: hypothetical protein ACOYJB_05790 [Christensenellaceae bacterium]|jgi:hypothetical protein